MTDSTWEYLSFYFGNATWPSDAIWRRDPETGERQLLIPASTGRETVEELRGIWEDARADHTLDPHYTTWTVQAYNGKEAYELHALYYWIRFDDEAEAQERWDKHLSWDKLGGTPFPYKGGTALYEENDD